MEHLTLTEAIRRGSTMGEQITNALIEIACDSRTHEERYNTCAIGAAAVACGYHRGLSKEDLTQLAGLDGRIVGPLYAAYPELTHVFAVCPLCHSDRQSLRYVITHLNDKHDWTREAIADWLDEQTLTLTPAAVLQEAT